MKKYIVRVQYTESCDLIWLVKAKNDRNLENIIAIAFADCQSLIDGYEYEAINNRMFKKNDINFMCGNWVGVDVMKDDLKKLKEKKS